MAEALDYLAQVQRGIDFIEAHLEERFALREVSRVAGISHWHFQRIFKGLTGETLMTYVRARRLANSLDRLLRSEARILDIALDAGFESQAAFTRAFKEAFGMTPGRYREIGDQSLFLQKVRIDADYLTQIHQNVSLEPTFDVVPTRRFIGLRTEYFGADSHKNDQGSKLPGLWQSFMLQLPSAALQPICYGVVEQISDDADVLRYHAAVEVSVDASVPRGMDEVVVPGGRYATFAHRGPAPQIDHTVNYIYSTWLAGSGLRHTYGADLEIYDRRYHPTSPDSVIGYAIPVT